MIFLSLLLSGFLTLVELNCENLFDYFHDEGKQDEEYLPDATRHWNKKRYWRKLNHTAQTLLSASDDGIPDLIALCEVENDSVMRDLTRRSLLRNAGYEYLVTQSPDLRGIDVALLYSPFTFSPIQSYPLRVKPVENMRPTRDILYVSGLIPSGDTIHVFVVHLPSRFGGERYSRPFRQAAAERLCGVLGTYRYKGEWGSIDHILGSPYIYNKVEKAFIHAPLFLLEEDKQYGGFKPRRTYNGMRYQPGYSDHLPLVVRIRY